MRSIDFEKKARTIHGDQYDYIDLPTTVLSPTTVNVRCRVHDVTFGVRAHMHLYRRTGCMLCRNDKTSARLTKTTDWFVTAAQSIHGHKYTYAQVGYTGTQIPVEIVCKSHGPFLQTPNHHLNGRGCPTCGRSTQVQKRKAPLQQFIRKATAVHGSRYDYSAVDYVNCKTKVNIVCPNHGNFYQTPNSHLSGCGCPRCKSSRGEVAVSTWLQAHNIEHEFQSHRRWRGVDMWFDFVVGDIAIEIDGIQHREYNSYFHKTEQDFHSQQRRDEIKTQYCLAHDIHLYRIIYTGKNLKHLINTTTHILKEHNNGDAG